MAAASSGQRGRVSFAAGLKACAMAGILGAMPDRAIAKNAVVSGTCPCDGKPGFKPCNARTAARYWAREIGAGVVLANPVRSGRKQP